MRRRSRRKPTWFKLAANWAGFGILYVLSRVMLVLPFDFASALGDFLGILVYHLGTEERNRAFRHLRLAFGEEMSRGRRRAVAQRVFRNFGRALTEAFAGTRLSTGALEKRVINAGELQAHLLAVLEEGKGLIAMTGHLGNWELLGTLGARYVPLSVVANRFHFEPFNRLTEKLRGAGRMKTIYLNENPRAIVKALKANECVGVLPDQDIRRLPGTYVRFFGMPAWTPIGPVLTAKLSGAPMIPFFLVRKGSRYFAEIGERIPMIFTGVRRADLLENTQRWSDAYEGFIRKYPDQWSWNHLRWNTRPSELPEGFLRHATLPSELREG